MAVWFAVGLLAVVPSAARAAALDRPAGTVTAVTELDHRLWIPQATSKGFRLTYVTTDARGRKAASSGELFIPKGTAPTGGWPVISWAHGTSGLDDSCAPSIMGPAEPERDFGYLRRWMEQGYAVVASDYVGLGTAGLPAYLNGRSEAHNVVDAVKAGRAYARRRLGAGEQLSDRWIALGQSQGGGAAIYTARYATEFGGPGLQYLGAVGTGVPANVEDVLTALGGPGTGVSSYSTGITAYMTYLLVSVNDTHPELGMDGILTDVGRKFFAMAKQKCVFSDFQDELKGVDIGDYFTRRLDSLPNWTATIEDYMAMPESGFDKPFFMGHGLADVDVPFAITAPYVAKLEANEQPLTFRPYATDHSGALLQSQADTVPFAAALRDAAGPGPDVAPVTRRNVRLARPTRLQTARRRGLRVRVTASALTPVRVKVAYRGRRIGSAAGRTGTDAATVVRVKLTRAFARATRAARAVKVRLHGAGATRAVVLRRRRAS